MSDAKTNNDRDQLKRSSASVIFATVGWQVICGLAICIGFYALIHMQILTHPLVVRYFAGHPVEYVTTALFFIGMVALSLNGLDAVGQFGTLNEVGLGPRDDQPQSTGDLPRLLHALRELPGYIQASLLAQRFTNILHYVQRKGTVQGLDAELKHLSDVDAQ